MAGSVLDAFRRWGYLEARIDPLGRLPAVRPPELDHAGPEADAARSFYCGPIGAEFMHLPEPAQVAWVQERMESAPPEPDRSRILDLLTRAETFEQVLQRRYLGTKRYSIEGATALLPLLDALLRRSTAAGIPRAILGMTHRGRLNVMVNILGIDPVSLFAEFEDVDPQSVLGGGDVKYHLGASGTYTSPDGATLPVTLVPNPSHLEAVDPVVLGLARAERERVAAPGTPADVLTLLLHGDAAFAGQGMVGETLNVSGLRGYGVGGTIHVIVNNLIGFTTPPESLHTSRFASAAARRLPVPIFHVNGEDPDAVARVAEMAFDYRRSFGTDVVIDLVGYRRHGHSEVEDPTVTQPLLYGRIAAHPPLWEIYARAIGSKTAADRAARVREGWEEAQGRARSVAERPALYHTGDVWSGFHGGPHRPEDEVETGVEASKLQEVAERMTSAPQGFALHPKIAQLLQERRRMALGERPVDWATGEALAFGVLVTEGTRVRLSGQDSRRGTFNQRHAALIDVRTGGEHVPLANLDPAQAPFECIDSPLSEAAILGYEYGYSLGAPDALVLWEAQFGDFANGAQVILDQFVCSAEDKWGVLSGLVLLLPHGFEGQGPEHSSARLERFLQLAAEDNWQVCQPSTSAQYFHLLRRQARRRWRKPLVVLTPKSLLRHPAAAAPIGEFSRPRFQLVVEEPAAGEARQVVLCTGKVGHELRAERDRRGIRTTALVFIEQLYPWPGEELAAAMGRIPKEAEVVWVQEEPANMGALAYAWPHLRRLAESRRLRSVKRSPSASPATGSMRAHRTEQAALFNLTFLPERGAPRPGTA